MGQFVAQSRSPPQVILTFALEPDFCVRLALSRVLPNFCSICGQITGEKRRRRGALACGWGVGLSLVMAVPSVRRGCG
jgi:hypothetical protein